MGFFLDVKRNFDIDRPEILESSWVRKFWPTSQFNNERNHPPIKRFKPLSLGLATKIWCETNNSRIPLLTLPIIIPKWLYAIKD